VTDEKRMRLRYAGTCRVCGSELPARTEAIYDRASKSVRCLVHEGGPDQSPIEIETIEPGVPGASARREFERRKASQDERIRSKHPKLGGLILALTPDPQSMSAWDIGAVGEEKLGHRLSELASDTLRVLHDRRIPNSRANIDHLAVTRSGIYVIDAKKYTGRPNLRIEGGLFRPRIEKLLVGTRDCTKLVDGVLSQVSTVRGVIGDEVPVYGNLCFVDADWPLIGGSFITRGVETLWPKRLCSKLDDDGPLDTQTIADIHSKLARTLPPA
jgi:hypothetical protein